MKWRCIVVDFDHTLARLDDPPLSPGLDYPGLFQIFTLRGVPEKVARESYRKVKASNGFSVHHLTRHLSERGGFDLDEVEIQKDFRRYLEEKLLLYPDTLPAVRRWRALGIPVVILTAGEESYQQEKVRATKIPYDDLLIIPRANEKTEFVHALLERYGRPIAVFDDKATELDALRNNGLSQDEVITVRVRRPDSPYYDQPPRHRHIEVAILTDDALVGLLGIAV